MILITGAAGFVGRVLVDRLLKDGHKVRVLVSARTHRPGTFPWVNNDQVTLVQGSLNNIESLHQAMLGVHTVFHLASAQWWGRQRDLQRIDVGGTQNLVAAGRSARIGRLIMLSHLGASPASAFTLLKIKGQVEEIIKSSGLAFTIFRSGIVFGPGDTFVNGIAQLLRANPVLYFQPGHGEGLLHPIYIGDLVEALVRSMENLDTVDQVISVGGPEYVTYNEMVRTIMRVTRAPRMIVNLPPYLLRFSSRLTNRFFPYWPLTPQWLDILASNRTAPMGTLFNVFGIQPARFEDTILTYMPDRQYRRELAQNLFKRRSQVG